jgi:AmmeMemoRadiSam system protein A
VAEGRALAVDPAAYPEALRAPRATFVTLERRGALRGCIGSLEARRALVADVAENAWAAAFRDLRFPPLAAAELEGLAIHVSLLSRLERIAATSEQELLAALRPGVDGLVLSDGTQRGTFLPAVWADLPEPRGFLRQLKRKAGLPADGWSASWEAWRYTVDEIG